MLLFKSYEKIPKGYRKEEQNRKTIYLYFYYVFILISYRMLLHVLN